MTEYLSRAPGDFGSILQEDVTGASVMVAIYPPTAWIDKLAPLAAPDQRDTLHLTVLYLGERTMTATRDIQRKLRTVAPKIAPLDLNITGSGAFFTPGALVRVLLINSPQLPRARFLLESAMGEIKYLPKQRYGHMPHITLEYHKDRKVPPGWEQQARVKLPPWRASHLHLVRGDLLMESFRMGGGATRIADVG